ncbi:Metallo-hydrolase/oxidoreductase [Rhizodiscina lignyota]|uniref:Metallo-hydrolase/oxidoreductase n=1 Tax=Rhizodiscina lignyota TaxID=1504668 RepID=A0A9P4M6N6_9PEZI|nr:Metallo-hydrolase/oxidoreductase [Rhizodiscina lignyota]
MSSQREGRTLPVANASVRVHLLDGGSFGKADIAKLHNGRHGEIRLYDWCFLIQHRNSGRNILWDLGISSDRTLYTPWVLPMYDEVEAIGPRQTLQEQLRDRGVEPKQVDTVIFSHAHWDHCRPFTKEFPNARAYFGPGTKRHCSPGHLENGEASSNVQWDGRFFDIDGRATEPWSELEGPWKKFDPFHNAMDFFGDGSVWIIQAPGHMPGNLCAAVKVEGSDSWVVLGSDCCHSRAILEGEEDIAIFQLPDGEMMSLHSDIAAARETIARLRRGEHDFKMHIALAHDIEWMKSAKDDVLISLLSAQMKSEWLSRVRQGERP